jgi:uncharacterized protein (DUF488 family)
MPPRPVLWSIGHSNHELERFCALVLAHRLEYLVDVRSYPYSRIAPHFNLDELQPTMKQRGVRYLFLGQALGGRPEREDFYDAEGHALYGRMAAESAFQDAIDRLLLGGRDHRLGLLCSCGRPDVCHRRLLIGKVLCDRGAELHHILPDGSVTIERSVRLSDSDIQGSLLEDEDRLWRSARSVSRRRRLSGSSVG